jgi:ATP-dependent helicase/nuclease subunit A
LFGLDEQLSEDTLIDELGNALADGEIDALLETLQSLNLKPDDRRLKANLETARTGAGEDRVAGLRQIFCTQAGAPRKRLGSKAFETASPSLYAGLVEAQTRFRPLDLALTQLRCAEASAAVLLLADAIHDEYSRAKQAEAVLDYDDLIHSALSLLARSGAAAWVLFKIDGGIDHILVDEAQDTNPEQWRIVERLVEEFFAGEGASERLRTMFAVGDEKQSIYSFQGADPARFGSFGRSFARKAHDAQRLWHEVPLNLSFRSTEPILTAVDRVFAKPPAASGLTWQPGAVVEHHAYREGQAGIIELWEAEAETGRESAPAFEPWNDKSSDRSSVEALCGRIANLVRSWLDNGETLLSEGRPVRPGDILILIRRRDPFATPMIRALKRMGVPVAGADRMRLMEQLAVQDLVALADFLLMPEDDLALAVVLKSPLFGLDDDDLFALAHKRQTSLWTALKTKPRDNTRFAEAGTRLRHWLARADLTPPFEFFSDLLGQNGQLMRQRMLTRLGPEAAEALDEFLTAALAYDRHEAPSLQGFVHQLRTQDLEIKRDMEQDRDEVRIMTVHGAKGLQAPIVFLPDTCMLPRRQGARIYTLPRASAPPGEVAHIVWPAGASCLPAIDAAKDDARDAELEEYHRLLYVAMTRAQDRLYVCGWHGPRGPEKASWLELVQDGLGGLLTEGEGLDGRPVWRLESAQTATVRHRQASELETPAAPLPRWAKTPAPRERSRNVLSPSRIGMAAEGEAGEFAGEQPPLGPRALAQDSRFARGRLVHALLQHLPSVAAGDRERAAKAFVAARGVELSEAVRGEIVAETLAIVSDRRFAPLFDAASLAEVPVIARLGEGEETPEVAGQIDRLALLDDEILILDYKTNRPAPERLQDVAPAYIAQLAAYRAALRGLATGRALRATLLWTDGPRLMEIPKDRLDAAERRMLQAGTSLDGPKTRT